MNKFDIDIDHLVPSKPVNQAKVPVFIQPGPTKTMRACKPPVSPGSCTCATRVLCRRSGVQRGPQGATRQPARPVSRTWQPQVHRRGEGRLRWEFRKMAKLGKIGCYLLSIALLPSTFLRGNGFESAMGLNSHKPTIQRRVRFSRAAVGNS